MRTELAGAASEDLSVPIHAMRRHRQLVMLLPTSRIRPRPEFALDLLIIRRRSRTKSANRRRPLRLNTCESQPDETVA